MSEVAFAVLCLLAYLAGIVLLAGIALCVIAADSDDASHELHNDQARGPEWPSDLW